MKDLASRQSVVDRVLADPPVVHYMSIEDWQEHRPLSGVWSTEESCYRFLAVSCSPGSRTLETGSGISTILFAAWGAEHVCVTPGAEEAEAVLAYCKSHEIPTDTLTIEVDYSDAALPRLFDGPPLDIVLIDGSHGFPTPAIDWYYGAGRLRRGGVVVVDDLELPAVRMLTDYLDRDGRWALLQRSAKWVAYRRDSEGPLGEDWFMQPFYAAAVPRWRQGLGWAEARARRLLRPAKRAVRSRLSRS